MSEQISVEQKAKDLRDGLRMVENKTIDGIPWYCAEAMAEEIARLRAENEALKATAQNFRILKAVDGLDPASTQYIAVILAAVDRAEAAEAEVLNQRRERSELNDVCTQWRNTAEAAEAKLAAVEKERDDFERKGIELCQVFGHLLMEEQQQPRAALTAKLAAMEKAMGDSWNCHECGMNHPWPSGPCPDRLPAPEKKP